MSGDIDERTGKGVPIVAASDNIDSYYEDVGSMPGLNQCVKDPVLP